MNIYNWKANGTNDRDSDEDNDEDSNKASIQNSKLSNYVNYADANLT